MGRLTDEIERAQARLTLNQEMRCDKEFSPIKCRKCDYYYVADYISYDVARCLKNDIKDWTLYRISKGE